MCRRHTYTWAHRQWSKSFFSYICLLLLPLAKMEANVKKKTFTFLLFFTHIFISFTVVFLCNFSFILLLVLLVLFLLLLLLSDCLPVWKMLLQVGWSQLRICVLLQISIVSLFFLQLIFFYFLFSSWALHCCFCVCFCKCCYTSWNNSKSQVRAAVWVYVSVYCIFIWYLWIG